MYKKPKISIIGAGNGGQAIAGFCASEGYEVCLFNRNLSSLTPILEDCIIKLTGALEREGKLALITDEIKTAVEYADIIMVATTATAHADIAHQMLPYLRNDQIILLNPGRTLGVLEVKNILKERHNLHIHLGEAQTLIYACRLIQPGIVNIIGVKERVMLSGIDKLETHYLVDKLNPIFHCFIPAENLIQTGLENIGAIFHPSVVLFNAATIERNTQFYFYRDMTPNIASFIMKHDKERINIGNAFGIELMSVYEWIEYAYPKTWGSSLCERMMNNPAYHDILGPGSIFTRQLTEDIPTGILPMSELGNIVGIKTPLMNSIIELSSALLGIDFKSKGRTLKNMGLDNLDADEIKRAIS